MLTCRRAFELPGCDPEKGGTAWLFDPDHALGLTVTFTGAEAAAPSGPSSSTLWIGQVRCVDRQGKPVSKADLSPCIVFSRRARSWRPTAYPPKMIRSSKATGVSGLTTTLNTAGAPHGFAGLHNPLGPGARRHLWVTSWGPLGNFDRRKGGQKEEFRVQAGKTLTLPDFVTRK